MSKTVKPFEFAKEFMRMHNSLFDVVMPSLGPNSWKVYCFIIRKTWGYSKDTDAVSYSQIAKGCGISSPQTISSAIKELRQGDYIFTSGEEGEATRYRLNDQLEIGTNHYENRSATTTKIVVPTTTKIVVPTTTKIVVPTTTKIVVTRDTEKKQKKLRAIACEPIQDSAIKCAGEGTNESEGNMNTGTGQSHDLFIIDTETKTNRMINAAKGAEDEKDLVRAFFRLSNLPATKVLVNQCITAARECINRKVIEGDIEAAYAKSKEGNGFFVASLWSLVGVAGGLAHARREAETPQGNPDWEWRTVPSGERVLVDKVNGTVYKGSQAREMARQLGVPA